MARPKRLVMAESKRTLLVRNEAMEFHKIPSWASDWKAKALSRGNSDLHLHLMGVELSQNALERNLPLP
jgi:hypothetical protein